MDMDPPPSESFLDKCADWSIDKLAGGRDWVQMPEHTPYMQSSSLSSLLVKHSGFFTEGPQSLHHYLGSWSVAGGRIWTSFQMPLTGSCIYC